MAAAVEATGIGPAIDRTHPLGGIAGAFRLRESRTYLGKICREL